VATARSSAGLDVLVEAEEDGRVVNPLEPREPLVIALPVGRAHALLAFVAEERLCFMRKLRCDVAVGRDPFRRPGSQCPQEASCPGAGGN
jgi:hypothetical protein